MNTFILWLLLRILTSIFASVVSSIKLVTPIEMKVPLFPPSTPISKWLDRVFLSPWFRYDAEWYQRIVTRGYSATDGTAQFHPLYPWLATPLAKIGFHPILSMLLISSLAGIALFFFFQKLARFDLSQDDASYSLMLFAFAPLAFILFAPYPESLFLLLAVLCFYFIRQQKWWLAGILGGLATLTRQQGIFLIMPMAWELWENNDRKFSNMLRQWQGWVSLFLIPLGFIIWIAYRAFALYDLQINFDNFQQFVYSFLISSSASRVVQVQEFLWPWQALYLALSKLFSQPDLDLWVNMITAALFVFLLALSWKRIRLSYRIYSLIIAVVSFSYYTGPVHPYMGLPRHLYLAFPIYFGLAPLVNKPWLKLFAISLSAIWMLFLLGLYVLHAWVP